VSTSPPLALRLRDFCAATGLGKTKTYELIAQGKLKSVKVGARRLIPYGEAERLIRGEGA
jgi:excisionase family DNA binding protein